MATKKKRTSLDALISPAGEASALPAGKSKKKEAVSAAGVAKAPAERHELVRHMLYLPLPVFDQLRELFFEEQRGQMKGRKIHDYFLEGIDLLFEHRGLKSIEELTGKK